MTNHAVSAHDVCKDSGFTQLRNTTTVSLSKSQDHSHTRLHLLDIECFSTDVAFLVRITASSPCCCQGRLPRLCSQQSRRSSGKVSADLCALEEHDLVHIQQQVRGARLAVHMHQMRRLLCVPTGAPSQLPRTLLLQYNTTQRSRCHYPPQALVLLTKGPRSLFPISQEHQLHCFPFSLTPATARVPKERQPR